LLVSKTGIKPDLQTENIFENDDYIVAWRGLVYILDIPSGLQSIEEFIKHFNTDSVEELVLQLKGNYFVSLCDKKTETIFSFTDCSGVFDVFYTQKNISTSFLDLIRLERLTIEDINPQTIIEFLNLGAVHQDRTFFTAIKKIKPHELITMTSCGEIKKINKKIESLDVNKNMEENDFINYFRTMANSLSNNNVSVDLTGGIDSRIITTLFSDSKLKFETSVAGSKDDTDIKIAKKVAKKINRTLNITSREIMLDEASIQELFLFCDGLYDILNTYSAFNNHQDRMKRGVDLIISGVGGELFKDFWWLQDFPNYKNKKSNIERLFRTRISPIKVDNEILVDRYKEINSRFEENTLEELNQYLSDINTKTYDNIYYFFKMQTHAGRLITISSKYINSYAPLLEFDLVRYGYHLPRSKRFFNKFHRDIITTINSDLAEIETTEGGMSISSKPFLVGKDSFTYIKDKGKRLTKKLGQRFFKKTFFAERYHHEDFHNNIKKLAITKTSIETLKRVKILNKKTTIDKIRNDQLGKIISLGLFISFLEENNTKLNGQSKKEKQSRNL
jgi:asparagine synthetase B (glutamine-hydrolysing)